MRTMSSRHLRTALAAGASLSLIAGLSVGAHAAVVPPIPFPAGVGLATTAYTLQFFGDNREGTAAAIAINAATSKVKSGGYPFQAATPNADPSSASYGPATCPKTLVLAADDKPADALAAAGLYGTATLTLTDSTGKAATFDTKGAVLLLTQSGREGASQLDTTTNAAIGRIKAGCSGTINGIVLGGTVALPDSVLDQFKAQLGSVARIAGIDRDDTARAIATAVAGSGGAALPTIHYFPAPSTFGPPTASSSTLTKTVFLAEDQTGADALAVGAVASRLGVPVLLSGTDALPQATANALGALAPHNIVVLGGTSAISDSVIASAKGFAGSGSTAIRIFGANRYATSVAIAEQLFNLYPDYVSAVGANAYSDQLFGLARDEGSEATGTHVGWPDALASAYYLASLAGTGAPARNAAPVEKSRTNDGSGTDKVTDLTPSACGGTGSKCSPFTPLLTTMGSALSPEIDSYLKAMYPAGGAFKTGSTPTGTNDGGFGFVFGGSAAVSANALQLMAIDLSGQTYAPSSATDLAPRMPAGSVFYTQASLANFVGGAAPTAGTATFAGPAASAMSPAPTPKVCVMPGGASGVAGIDALNDQGGFVTTNPVDYFGPTAAFIPGTSLGSCIDLTMATPASKNDAATVFGSSLSGNVTPPVFINYLPAQTLEVRALGNSPQGVSTNAGSVFTAIPSGASSETETLTYTAIPMASATYKGTSISGATGDLTIVLTRAKGQNSKDIVTWTGTFTLKNGATSVFSAAIAQGMTDQAPATGAAIQAPINLLGLYSAPGLGALVLTVNPAVVPTTSPSVSNIEASGNA